MERKQESVMLRREPSPNFTHEEMRATLYAIVRLLNTISRMKDELTSLDRRIDELTLTLEETHHKVSRTPRQNT